MRNVLILMCCFLFFSSLKCKKDKACHSFVSIINNSNQNIIPALKFTDPNNQCILSGSVIAPGASYKRSTNGCWEDKLTNGNNFDFYIVDPSHYNTPNVFYNCDSIEIKNNVLKHYILTLDNLKNMNFVVTYP